MDSSTYILKALAQLIQLAANSGTSIAADKITVMLQLVNAERTKVGAKSLILNGELNKLALMKSQDMVSKAYFSHHSPTYGSPFDMMRSYGISYFCAGENLAIAASGIQAHDAWMKSQEHRKNILNPSFAQIGIGLCPKGTNSYAYTHLFIG